MISHAASLDTMMGVKGSPVWLGEHGKETSAGDGPLMNANQVDQKDIMAAQSLKYAEDLARIYVEEKARRKALEKANERLRIEVVARRRAEKELLEAKQELENRVQERTKELSWVNSQLRAEIERRRNVEQHIKASLKEKQVLLSEIHHRVKNNLQIISSLLALQATHLGDENVVAALLDCQNRIRSIAMIHEQLYHSEDVARIDFSAYLGDLIRSLVQAQADKRGAVTVQADVEDVHLSVAVAVPCSLIINELVTNSLKHAFPHGGQGQVRIGFRREERGGYLLTVSDNGVGLPTGFDYRNTSSLGLQLAVNLAELQLRGKLTVHTDNGTEFRIEFPDSPK